MYAKKTYGGFTAYQLVAASGFRCIYCQNEVQYISYHMRWQPRNLATIEHLMPKAHVGSDELHNVKIACRQCNDMRGVKDYRWFKGFVDDLRLRSSFVQNWHELRPGELQFVKTMCRTRYQHWHREHQANFIRRRPINT